MLDRKLVVLCAGNFIVATSLHIVAGLLTEIADSLQVSIAQAGFLIAAFAVTSCICAPLFAAIGSRLDRRYLLVGSMLVCALANGLAALSETYGQLLITRLLAAVTSAIFTPQAAAVLSVMIPVDRRAQAITVVMSGWGLAAVAGIPLGVLMGHVLGWRATMAGISVIGLLVALALWLSLPAKVHVPSLSFKSWLSVLRSRPLMFVLGASLLLNTGNSVAFSYLAAMVASLYEASGKIISSLFLVHGLGSLTSTVVATLLMARLGAHRIAFILSVCVLLALVLWPVAAASLSALFVLQFFWSMGFAGFPPVQQARLVIIAPALASASVALNSSLNYLSAAIGASLGGGAWEVVGPRYLPWVGILPVMLALFFIYKSAVTEPNKNNGSGPGREPERKEM